jgi:hypothetical protein
MTASSEVEAFSNTRYIVEIADDEKWETDVTVDGVVARYLVVGRITSDLPLAGLVATVEVTTDQSGAITGVTAVQWHDEDAKARVTT